MEQGNEEEKEAIEAILNESERLEDEEPQPPPRRSRKGKQKASIGERLTQRSPSASNEVNEGTMWKVLAKLQEEVKSLKRPNWSWADLTKRADL